MRRREFIALVGNVAVARPSIALAQTAKPPVIGFLGFGSSESGWVTAFEQRLGELGWVKGRTVEIEYRQSEGRPDRVAAFAAEFVRRKVDVIVTYGSAVPTFKQATTSIPVVFAIASDPVGIGLVASLSHPGGNVTGLSDQQTENAEGNKIGTRSHRRAAVHGPR